MPVLSKPPTGRACHEDTALVPSITAPLSPTVEEEDESDIEVVHSPAKVVVHEEDKAITPPLENNDPAIVDAFIDDDEITRGLYSPPRILPRVLVESARL